MTITRIFAGSRALAFLALSSALAFGCSGSSKSDGDEDGDAGESSGGTSGSGGSSPRGGSAGVLGGGGRTIIAFAFSQLREITACALSNSIGQEALISDEMTLVTYSSIGTSLMIVSP